MSAVTKLLGSLQRRDRIVVSTLRCGRNNPGSNPGHGSFLITFSHLLFPHICHGNLVLVVRKARQCPQKWPEPGTNQPVEQ